MKFPTALYSVGMCALLFLRLRMVGNNQKHQVTRVDGRSENLWGRVQGIINTKPFDSTKFYIYYCPNEGRGAIAPLSLMVPRALSDSVGVGT